MTGFDGRFDPNAAVTRQELAAMLYRYAGAAGKSADLSAFTDADSVKSWARDAMGWAVGAGLLDGRSGDLLAPTEPCTRAELATILSRLGA